MENAIVKQHPDVVVISPFPAGLCLTGKEICLRHHIPYSVIPFFKKDQMLFNNKILGEILNRANVVFTPTETEKSYIRRFTNNSNIRLLPSSINSEFIERHKQEIEKKSNILQADIKFKK